MFSRFLSFERPMGPLLVQLLYYIGIVIVVWRGVDHVWDALNYFEHDWDSALWRLIKAPFVVVINILVLRVVAEVLQAIFRIDKSTHDQVTGRAAPPKAD